MRKYTLPAILAAFLLTGSTALTPQSGETITTVAAVAANPTRFDVIDTYARNAPEAYAKSLQSLSEYLTSPARTDLAKARSIYAWITSHVRYDMSTYTGASYASEIAYANRALQSRRTVCTGFALLFKQLLTRAGVEAITVKGFSRYADSQAGLPTGGIDHEWNAVRLDGDWYLFDLTWACTTAQKGRPNDFYFMTDPQAFIAQHLPLQSRWQLLDRPVSKPDFDRFPKYYDAYFTLGFTPYFPKQGLLRAYDGVTLNLTNEENVEFWCSAGPRGSGSSSAVPIRITRRDDQYQLQVKLPARGPQTLYVFAKPKANSRESYKQYAAIASFTVQ
ncbi:transglutaminase domain-containing protein [Fibrella aquatilis]|uniref:Kyphoscoliosis peptidase n=1 Tax=Fibrella aquatilis TaxID=2817059 RepID=A0A939JZP4_9BACT|nr:transglutaminase domain-containing protein [Fibrella aquatilis]MBO0930400.1 Kyphoscoliosis peptidase [Fibrella aquatilis]